MSVPLDAREILNHLNQLGYRNITPEQLKEFQKDLRKLIKFDTRVDAGASNREALKQAAHSMNTFQRLHTLTTISYDAKHDKKGIAKPSSAAPSEMTVGSEPDNAARTEQPRGNSADKENQHECGKSKKPSKEHESAPNKMWIRTRSTSATGCRKNDPVALYHAYKKEWERFKDRLPGENNHSELRWRVRNKLLGEK
ncbi:centriolar and ciliogenesis-associated protein hyls-1 [Toxorhynchites rutilus septentrionalis]|uniref:centriolar and ciliogenesis-associated protein hyls-1 n=1 Tax=Toxorhynchites rutilus septentrionalis TaxID=329112 RepID=UPI00247A93B5|nr:centriolar and ciliogenesis-associated protein hyls-1 [Toxorhynchites rutilus septentrionalis]